MTETYEQKLYRLREAYPTGWIKNHSIKNESGFPIEFDERGFLFDIYNDLSPFQVVLKPPQIGMTVLEVLKSMWVAKNLHKDIIYTLPTKSDVNDMAGGKVNRLIAQNPILMEWVKDHDTIEQKAIGDNIIYYRGTFTTKQAMMVASSLNVHDEVDASDPSVIEQYETRLQAKADGWRWYFSHPSVPDYGVDKYWQISDQKHWFIKCPHCKKEHYLDWPDSIDIEKRCFICKLCKGELTNEDRKNGRWIKRYEDKQFSGYWVSQLMCPWITADKILTDFKEKSADYFYNYVLGLPFAGGDSKLTQEQLFANLTHKQDAARPDERVVIGIDTGARLDFVLGNQRLGIFHQGDSTSYEELNTYMKRWPKAIAIIDAGGDFIGAQEFFEKWPDRVFKAYAGADRKSNDLTIWDIGQVTYDLNRMWQLCVDEFRETKIPLQGTEDTFYEYWLDWRNMSRIKVEDPVTKMFKGIKWIRNGRNHRASATLFWRIGIEKFGTHEEVSFFMPNDGVMPDSPGIELDGTLTRSQYTRR
jgi:hypothetical protein